MRKAVTSDRGASEQSGPLRPAGGRRVHSHRGLFRGTAATALATALALIVTLVIPAGGAQAVDYPSWQDVQNAKSNTAAASAKVTEIQNLISNLQTQVAQTQAESEKRGAELQVAQQNYDDATRRASDLQAQADTSKATADAATKQAGQLAAQLYRTGGTDLTVNLFLDGDAPAGRNGPALGADVPAAEAGSGAAGCPAARVAAVGCGGRGSSSRRPGGFDRRET
ncbi:hypothetical protein QN345_09675, partial [Cryobacterium sp. 10I1]|nr:hypothetical protein [Cryobacterium sp. 10I1]